MLKPPAVASPPDPAPAYLNFLWVLNLLWTLILLVVNITEFLKGGQWTYQGPGSLIYFATLAAYAGVKETHNWTVGEGVTETKGRRGVLFVGVWVIFSMVAFLAVNYRQGYVFPHELLTINLEVMGIFFGTQASKALRKGRSGSGVGKKDGIEEGILQLASRPGGVGLAEVVESLGVNRNEAHYALGKLVREGRLKKVGSKRSSPNTKYVAV